ncbi:MAG TPA: ATP-binding cassette domain-containing protein [Thermoanaerobaculia bacterium]|nr:ATP-binding cassette domain-containing protein [Thermoanaerobaculia bacterium]
MTPTVELVNLRKAYDGHVAVDDLSLAIAPGTVFGLLGPNGAGKTTTIRMVMDILGPDRGEVRLFGRPRRPEDGRRIGYLPEERGLYRKMTVADQLHFLAALNGVERGRGRRLVADWLGKVDLAEWADKKVETLSKGMQQKVQLIATVLHDPELLILDEPFSGLDPINQGLFKELIVELRGRGRTIVFSTHIMEQAEKLCDEIGLVARGRLILTGNLAAIKRERGPRAVAVRFAGAPPPLAGVPGISAFELGDDAARLTLADGATPAGLLAALVAAGAAVAEYRSLEPDLESIFVHAVQNAN